MTTQIVHLGDTPPEVRRGSDSSTATDATEASSSSISSSAITFAQKDRGFHSFQDELYCLPNDDDEHRRLNLQDSIWKLCLQGRLHLAPLESHLKHIVDIGTGTACWATDFALAHPETHVLGTDLTPVQAKDRPANMSFTVSNANQAWDFGGQLMDFIHSRMLILGVPNWQFYFEQAYQHTKPGGWVEVKEPRFPICYIDDGAVTASSPMHAYSQFICEASTRMGNNLQACDSFDEVMAAQGFINIQKKKVYWAVGAWPDDPREREMGRLMAINTKEGLLPVMGPKLLGDVLGWSEDKVQTFLQQVKEDIDDPSTHYYLEFTLCCGQKPL